MKRTLLILFKYVLPLAIVGWLVRGAVMDASFDRLWTEPKDWPLLAVAAVLCFSAVSLTFMRWYFLVRAVNLPFLLRDAFRLGFLGYMFNFIAPGSVGGDLFKAVFIAREHPGRRTSAVASVIVDRLVGLYAMFLVASTAFLFTDVGRELVERGDGFGLMSRAVYICTSIGTIAGFMFLVPALTDNKLAYKLESLPKIGPLVQSVHTAIRLYRSRPAVILLTIGMSVCVHSLSSVSFWLIARALPGDAPRTLAVHFVIAPLSMLVGILPVMGNGLGVVEIAIKSLYERVGAALTIPVTDGFGLLVSLTYRVITILVAGVGFVYYMARRREVSKLIHEAEEAAPEDNSNPEVIAKASEPAMAV